MRRALASVLLGLLVIGVAPAAADDLVQLTPSSAPKFPDRAFRLTVPARPLLRPDQLTVSENGERVNRLSVLSAGGVAGRQFGAILVIDASRSMRGSAIRKAIEAARELASQRNPLQPLGVIVFNRKPTVVLAPSDDTAAIRKALSRVPRLSPQTHIYDAVNAALDQIGQAHISAGSIIVLSDGSDTGSSTTAAIVGLRARRANVRIFSVGLRSGAFKRTELEDLAAGGDGRYFPAESIDDLKPIFRSLGEQLASEYVLRYVSSATPSREVTVSVQVDGVPGVATSVYEVPGGASYVRINDSFWTSALGVAVTGALCALLLAVSLGILLLRRRRGPNVRERVESFVSSFPSLTLIDDDDEVVRGKVLAGTERSLERLRWWAGFKTDVEIARMKADPVRIVVATGVATFVAAYLLAAVGGVIGALFAIAIPLGVRSYVRFRLQRTRQEFADQLPDVLQNVASAIRAGHGLVGGIAIVVDDLPEPCRSEFIGVLADEQIGVPLDDALRVVRHRMDSREVEQVALVAEIQRETGGNMAEVLDRVTDAMRKTAELRRMVRSLTAQGRLSRWVVTALPIFLLIVITVLNRAYVEPLFTTTLGRVMLLAGAVSVTMGSLVIKKIVDFRV